MREEGKTDNRIPVQVGKHNQIVFAIPAKPKPPKPWWERKSLEILTIILCFIIYIIITVEG
jgi:hypothetical protein